MKTDTIMGLIFVTLFVLFMGFVVLMIIADDKDFNRKVKLENERTCTALLQHAPTYIDSLEISIDFPKCTSLLKRK